MMNYEIRYTNCPYCGKSLFDVLAPEGETRQMCKGCGHIFIRPTSADMPPVTRTMKEFEMSVTGTSSDEWDRQALEAQEARAAIRAEYEAELYSRYDAGELVIGCEEAPRICYGNRSNKKHFGDPHLPYHVCPERF